MNKWPAFLIPCILTSCAVDQRKDDKDPGIQTEPYHMVEPAPSLKGVKIPVLQSFKLEKRWGKPKMAVLPNGGYLLSYSDPESAFETLRIFGAPGIISSDAPQPPEYTDMGTPDPQTGYPRTQQYSQKWSTITLLGRPIHYYLRSPGGGADAPEFSTVSFPIETPGAPAASYRITTTSNLEDGTAIMEGYMRTVSF